MDVELEFDKKCRVSLSPKTVLPPSLKSSNFHKESSKQRRDQLLVVEECSSSNDIRFECYKSASCRTIPSRLSVVDAPVEFKRGSVYQDSREVMKMKRIGDGAQRRKIEISSSIECQNSDENYCQDLSVHPALIRPSSCILDEEACLSDGFIEIEVDENDDRRRVFRKGLCGDLSYMVEEVNGPKSDGNMLLEEDEVQEKLATPQTLSNRQSVDTPESRTKVKSSSSRFSPIKKMMDPFFKFKSYKTPPSFEANNGCGKSSDETLLSPVLHACLTLKTQSETPLFEFTMKCPDASFLARIWKRSSNAGDWVYTFHSVNTRKRRDFTRWGSNEDCKELPVVGQMQVSSRLCPESMVTEFILYDLANAVNSKSVDGSSDINPDISQLPKVQERHNLNQGLDTVAAVASPWEPATLHPHMETAAVIIQVPLERRESLKFSRRVDKESDESMPCINAVRNSASFDIVDFPEVVVVTPVGSHSLPEAENQGPASLLDRWRLGGGCECGGWDMGCPLRVFSSPVTRRDLISHGENTKHIELLVQGEKCTTSALSIKDMEEGKYDVTFHARLSALQAFSISVAMLHGSKTPWTQKGKNSNPTTQCSKLIHLVEHELELLMEAYTKEDPKQIRTSTKESHLSFAVDPPFSPMSRV